MNKILFLLFFVMSISVYIYTGARDRLGWVDDNTYRVAGKGHAREDASEFQRKSMACEAARLDAIANLMMKFAESGIKSVNGRVKTEVFQNIIRKEFSGTVKGMNVIESTYYEDKRLCKIIGEIYENNMRRRIYRLAADNSEKD